MRGDGLKMGMSTKGKCGEYGNGKKKCFLDGSGAAGEESGDRVRYQAGNLISENRVEREWLSTKEAAHYLRLSENALRIMVCRDQIRSHKIGRRLRFQLSDCQALFQKGGA